MALQRRKKTKRPGPLPLEEALLAKYGHAGIALLADEQPTRMDPSLRTQLESLIGIDLDGVRLHIGEQAHRMAESLGARAFAIGESDIFFARGQFAPKTAEGKALLAHELTHLAEAKAALRRRTGRPEREDLEASARRAEELVLAVEEAEKELKPEPAEAAEVEVPSIDEPQPKVATIDKAALEEKVFELLERQLRRERERSGRI